MERLRQCIDGDVIQDVAGPVDRKHVAKGMIIFSPDLSRVDQGAMAKLLLFHGAFVALCDDCGVVYNPILIMLARILQFHKRIRY